jgi:predicted membrane channel-forming protein YqfA (hemolysin III family)
MLFGAFVVNIPISMLLVSLFTKQSVNRKINMIAGSIMPLILLTSPPTDMDDYFHLTIEILALISIVTTSFKWKRGTKTELS